MEPNQSTQSVQPLIQNPIEPGLPSSSKNFWKYIGIGMAIVSFLTAIGIIGFVLSQKSKPSVPEVSKPHSSLTFKPSPAPDPTANWQLYQLKGFSLRIPTDWETSTNSGVFYFWPPGNKESVEDFGWNVHIEEFPGSIGDVKQFVAKKFWNNDATSAAQVKYTSVDVGGEKGFFLDGIPGCCEGEDVVVFHNGTFYWIGANENGGKTPITSRIFRQVLSTFKFVDQIAPTASIVGPGEHCGGNIANAPVCQSGYHCALSVGQTIPAGDVGGVCIVN